MPVCLATTATSTTTIDLQDHHAFKKHGMKECPAKVFCENCMPKSGGGEDDYECWAVKDPVVYSVRCDTVMTICDTVVCITLIIEGAGCAAAQICVIFQHPAASSLTHLPPPPHLLVRS
jgi:hypothetical protein